MGKVLISRTRLSFDLFYLSMKSTKTSRKIVTCHYTSECITWTNIDMNKVNPLLFCKDWWIKENFGNTWHCELPCAVHGLSQVLCHTWSMWVRGWCPGMSLSHLWSPPPPSCWAQQMHRMSQFSLPAQWKINSSSPPLVFDRVTELNHTACLPRGWAGSWVRALKCREVRRRQVGYPGELQQGGKWDLLRAVPLLSGSAGTRWAGLFYWEGRSKIGKAARSCPVRTLLRGWQRCLSGKIRIYLGMKGTEYFRGSRLQLFHSRGNRNGKLRGLSPS